MSGNVTVYIYDAQGLPIGMQYHGASYAEDAWDVFWYEKNLQGDIVAVYNESGTKLISYEYDAYGRCFSTQHNGGYSTQAYNNPFRYRGYYYDADLELYYLNSRYYDSYTGRFISADGVMSGVSGDLKGFNLYAYCFNNPVNMTDSSGNWPKWVEKIANAFVAIFNSVEAEMSVGVGIGAKGSASVYGVPVGAEILYAEKEGWFSDDGVTLWKHSSEASANVSLGPFHFGQTETNSHAYYNCDCGCELFTDVLTKASCPANESSSSNAPLSISISMGGYIGIGAGVSLGINLSELWDRWVEIFSN